MPTIGTSVTRILVDLDHTLSEGVSDPREIGAPVWLMVQRVRDWLATGHQVSVFTSRTAALEQRADDGAALLSQAAHQLRKIRAWCVAHVGVELPVTSVKTPDVVEIWDNCAVRVEPNTGRSELHDVHQVLDRARAVGSTLCERVENLVERLCDAEVEVEKLKDLLGDKNREISDLQDKLDYYEGVDY